MRTAILALLAAAAAAAAANSAVGQPAQLDPQAVISGLDQNGDGSVDLGEYLAYRHLVSSSADGDGQPGLSLDEFRASLDAGARLNAAAAFTRSDQNRDGALDDGEVAAYHTFVFRNVLDQNHDGAWTVDEFRTLLASSGAAAGARPPAAGSRPPTAGAPDPAVAIAAIDTDANGSVSATEYLGFQAIRFGQLDTDANGSMSLQEFTASLARPVRDTARSTFLQVDGDRDGQLSQREFLGYQTYVFNSVLDRNRDGAWTVDEYRAFLRGR